MASAPQQNQLPLLYKDLVPLQTNEHATWKARRMTSLSFLKDVHAMPLTTDEFVAAQRNYPIVFSGGPEGVPLALFGLNEGVNLFLDENDDMLPPLYIPAYVRRYPFMLARLNPQGDELSLCFDPTPDVIGEYEDGEPLFVDGQPGEGIKQTLEFCEQFEMSGQRTTQFMNELRSYDLLMEAEVTMQVNGVDRPFIYRGFEIVNEEKLRDLRGDQLRKMQQSGMLPLLHAHVFSLQWLPILFDKQYQLGLVQQQEQ